ncbi:MAG: signal transduction histidine kinase, partial [Myxococcota bacterium]
PALAKTVDEYLPGADRPPEELNAALASLAERFTLKVAIRQGNEIIASNNDEVAAIAREYEPDDSLNRFRHHTLLLGISGDRTIFIQHERPSGFSRLGATIVFIAALGLAVGIGAFPLVRRLTGRLERLNARVEDLGSGDLSTRVAVEGKDEIAELAQSFNQAADRIERLVNAQRSLLASASHELRTPLTRMRMAIELLENDNTRPEIHERIVRDIAELDELVGELLLASKLDSLDRLEATETVELLAIVAEEGARVHATTTGENMQLIGDPRMLRRLVRNLFENAQRYGAGSPIEARVEAEPTGSVRLSIEDRGPGVPGDEREKIFDPFYRPAGTRETADGGVGLGLSLVKKIAVHHGGDVRCLAREGGGTRFEVRLATRPKA